MQILSLNKANQKFDEFFNAAKDTMFKVEVLQDYSAIDSGPSLKAWLAGDEKQAKELFLVNKAYRAWIEACKASPATITRVHVVEYPLTPYLEWEIALSYKLSLIPSGAEDVYLVSKAKLPHVRLPDGDFWIFDNQRVVKFNYEGPKGRCVGGVVYDADDAISEFQKVREEVMKVAETT